MTTNSNSEFVYDSLCIPVQHGLVYLECKADGQWAKEKNVSECETNDLAQTDTVCLQMLDWYSSSSETTSSLRSWTN